MVERLLYAVHLIAALAGLVAIIGGCVRSDPRTWAWGASALALCFLCRLYLHQKKRLADCERGLNNLMSGEAWAGGDDTPEGAEFEALLERRDELELRRGTAAFDPWEVLSLQHQIDDCVRRHPEWAPLMKQHDST